MSQSRVRAGVPAGGRFARSARAESDVTLLAEPAQDDGNGEPWLPFRCGNCGQWAERGLLHACPARDLVPLTPTARLVVDACADADGRPLIVGGSVRDAMLSRLDGARPVTPKGVDIEVYDTDADTLTAALAAVGRVDEVGRSFGVMKVRVGHGDDAEDFDVSLPRADSKTGGGHRGFDVRVDNDLDEVSAFGRRDFTINAMGWDPHWHPEGP